MIRIEIKIELNPTEDSDKIIKVMSNFTNFNKDTVQIDKISEGYYLYTVIAYGRDSLQTMFTGLRNQRIVESARKYLMSKRKENSVSFMLNKQALYMNKFHFCYTPEESPMGPVWIRIESDNIIRILEYLVPHTIKGKPQEVDYIPE